MLILLVYVYIYIYIYIYICIYIHIPWLKIFVVITFQSAQWVEQYIDEWDPKD